MKTINFFCDCCKKDITSEPKAGFEVWRQYNDGKKYEKEICIECYNKIIAFLGALHE